MADDQHIQHFREELTAAFRALSGNAEANVIFPLVSLDSLSSARFNPSTQELKLPLPAQPTLEQLYWARGEADAVALKQRYHDKAKHQLLQANTKDVALLERLEEVRVEALGTLGYQGVAHNIQTRWQKRLTEKEWDQKQKLSEVPASEVLALLAYQSMTGKELPEASKMITSTLGKILGRKVTKELKALKQVMADQEAYGELVQEIGKKIQVESSDEDQIERESEGQGEEVKENANEDSDKATKSKVTKVEEQKKSDSQQTLEIKAPQLPGEDEDEEGEVQESDTPYILPPLPAGITSIYHPYTTQYDVIAPAETLADREELLRYRKRLDARLLEMRDITNRLATRLQRTLQATQMRSWDFNMEEGVLDPNKFSTLITDPSYAYPYKWERESEYKDTVVTLLLDNSGSMRGRPITMAALCGDILVRTLERCGVKVEVLGFTTQHWKGGESRKLWQEHGEPDHPGRLNDLLHIVYKSAGTPWRRARNNLGLMLKEGLLKENIDGEAVLWAYDRLLTRLETRKILMVISDGAPVDDSTLSTNEANYLDHHLRQVITMIERRQEVELLAIGIGHDVTQYYSRSVVIKQIEELGDAVVGEFIKLFDENWQHTNPLRAKTR